MLSTAILEGAHASILALYVFMDCNMNSTTVVVLPVPGGPCINDTSADCKDV